MTLTLPSMLVLTGGQMLEFVSGMFLGFLTGLWFIAKWDEWSKEPVDEDDEDWNYK